MKHEIQIKLQNRLGLHARAAAQFVKLASRYSAKIKVKKGSLEADGKSILGLLTLAAPCGTSLHIGAEGSDAQEERNASALSRR